MDATDEIFQQDNGFNIVECTQQKLYVWECRMSNWMAAIVPHIDNTVLEHTCSIQPSSNTTCSRSRNEGSYFKLKTLRAQFMLDLEDNQFLCWLWGRWFTNLTFKLGFLPFISIPFLKHTTLTVFNHIPAWGPPTDWSQSNTAIRVVHTNRTQPCHRFHLPPPSSKQDTATEMNK